MTDADKTARSVFVGNIPYDVTEEKLKEIFSEVGPVLSFKIVFDRESGKPKGYGFCEYQDVDTAQSAIRNLNGHEISGRVLRVDSASISSERQREAAANVPQIGQESIYGEAVEPAQAPEAISRAVASLPPEQMFELMKQMKVCIQNNPIEGRQMLLQNPQLAYSLLQALVVMKVVDPNTAVTMLQKSNNQPPVLVPQEQPILQRAGPMPGPLPGAGIVAGQLPGLGQMPGRGIQFPPRPPIHPSVEGPWGGPPKAPVPLQQSVTAQDVDFRAAARDMDMRTMPSNFPAPVPEPDARFAREPRPVPVPVPAPQREPRPPAPQSRGPPQPVVPAPGGPSGTDQEKAALIMQVLQLSDEQIALLPPEQRHSIMVLKEQIARSQGR
ncbi:cleavage stimulation factor subunit 2-like [Artemia franciscana]|uniref:cleavage stimulation factor subunit 2-like n=1 Tax=Artemia franciscana TaxID=6661 RepID=UPI0032DA9DC9